MEAYVPVYRLVDSLSVGTKPRGIVPGLDDRTFHWKWTAVQFVEKPGLKKGGERKK